tara:strand:- start:323 stop:811 length:489 start_codon:yes stop_codon:yes gene_type:complete
MAGIVHFKDIFFNNYREDSTMQNNEEIISRLKFIGLIEKDEKINIRYVSKQQNNWITSISRTAIYPDSRKNTLKFVQNIIERTFEIIDQHIVKNKILDCKNVILDLVKSKNGLQNLKHTYSDDTKFCCDMDVLIQKVCAKIDELKKSFENVFTKNEMKTEKK